MQLRAGLGEGQFVQSSLTILTQSFSVSASASPLGSGIFTVVSYLWRAFSCLVRGTKVGNNLCCHLDVISEINTLVFKETQLYGVYTELPQAKTSFPSLMIRTHLSLFFVSFCDLSRWPFILL